MMRWIDYTNDQRVLGNSLLAQAREHSVKVDELLTSLINESKRGAYDRARSESSRT